MSLKTNVFVSLDFEGDKSAGNGIWLFVDAFLTRSVQSFAKTIRWMLYHDSVLDFCEYVRFLKVKAATHLKQVGTGTIKDWGCCGKAPDWIIPQVRGQFTGDNIMYGYEKFSHESLIMQSFSCEIVVSQNNLSGVSAFLHNFSGDNLVLLEHRR